MYDTTTTFRRSRRRAAALSIACASILVASACSSDEPTATGPSTPTGARAEDLLGPVAKAQGEPVHVGFISDGASASGDFEFQLHVADAVVRYLNEHGRGIGGRPIELVTCTAGQNDVGRATDCANQLVQAGVVVTVLAESTASTATHKAMDQAKIPIVISSIADRAIVRDTEGTFVLSNPFANQWQLPIGAAKEAGVNKVTAVVIDYPQATELYTSDAGKATFADAGIALELVRIPPAQADMTPQMTQIANGDPTLVHIVGAEAFCTTALNGLRSSGYEGPISVLNLCATEATRKAVRGMLDNAFIGSATPVDDRNNPDFQKWQAIYAKYGSGVRESQMFLSLSTYMALMGMHAPVAGLTGEITPATITNALATMPSTKVPGGGGLSYRCDGKAVPEFPAICTRGTLSTRLDGEGKPIIPWKVVGDSIG